MSTIILRHLDNREFARCCHMTDFMCRTSWIIDAVACEFECDEEDISFTENEDGKMICVYGQPVAQSYVTYGRF